MNVAVIGNRDFEDYLLLEKVLNKFDIHLITSGGAKGADSLAEEYAKNKGIEINVIEAKWDDFSEPCVIKYNQYGKKYNTLAGFKRNQEIIKAVDVVIAFWDGKSPGTRDSIKKAEQLEKTVIVVNF